MKTIGENIAYFRKENKLTQEELADRCELTKGYISQVENDLTSPTISTLSDILTALGTNLSEFFVEEKEEQVVFHQEDYIVKCNEFDTTTWLVPNSQKNEMEPLLFELEPNSSTYVDMPHEGQEFGYVIEGEIQVIIGKKTYVCKKGETFYFTTNKDHYLKNNTKKLAKLIWVSSPPNF